VYVVQLSLVNEEISLFYKMFTFVDLSSKLKVNIFSPEKTTFLFYFKKYIFVFVYKHIIRVIDTLVFGSILIYSYEPISLYTQSLGRMSK
jgi:hypothetical protein